MTEPLDRLTAALADRYRIERELGAGGMATVYLAHDVRHDRKVALKVLRPELSAVIGAERFLVEIRTTANLQHPHILALYDSGQVDGTVFYVMPYVAGESLRERLAREKQLPVADAVRIATEVAGALDYAHRQGVIHRDIKPENILLHDGRALVADFGIALAASRGEAGSRMTETGMSLGTPHYMSPEQALGERNLDARSDVYALGCVLHEMLAGEPPFTGPTAQAIIARVMNSAPEPVTAVRKAVPDEVADAILTALEKLPADRFASAAEFANALAGHSAGPSRRAKPGARAAARPARLLWPAAVALAAALAAWGWLRPAPEIPASILSIPTPSLGGAGSFLLRVLGLTPDGRTLLYVDMVDGEARLVRRPLDQAAETPLPNVPPLFSGPVVSPDGREFVAASLLGTQMFRFSIDGGAGKPLPRDLAWGLTMTWGGDGSLWLTPQSDLTRGIARVLPTGEITHPFGPELNSFTLQQVLPGDRYGLAVRSPVGTSFGPPFVLDLETHALTSIMPGDVVEIRYTSGLLVYVLPNGTMEAVRFDLRNRRASGAPVIIATDVSLTGGGTAQITIAPNGTVAYVPDAPRSLVLTDRAGNARVAVSEGRNFHIPRFSPDGRRLLTDFTTADGRDVWQLDLASGGLSRVTFDRDGHDATWEPDGRHIAYISASRSGGALTLYRTLPGRASEVDSLISSPTIAYTGVWLPDRSAIVTGGNSLAPDSRGDIAIIRNAGRGPVEPLVATRFEESFPAVSPDGRWLAYTSDQTGPSEVYVRPLDRDGEELRVSLAGGSEPVWGPGGQELFYRAPVANAAVLVSATLAFTPTLTVTARQELFDVTAMATTTPHSNYDISPDGRTFAMVRTNPSSRIVVIQNLPAIFERLEQGRVR
ncbi:MAG TPA: protein kinase [Gemmatimonadales bacterium]